MEGLIEKRQIKMPDYDPNNPASVKAWQDISADFAAGASGNVSAVIGKDLRPGNIWESVELPALKKNPNVNRITIIDPDTGIERVVFQR